MAKRDNCKNVFQQLPFSGMGLTVDKKRGIAVLITNNDAAGGKL